MLRLLPSVLLIFFQAFAFANADQVEPLFVEGTKLYQEQKYVDAIEKFSAADALEQDNPQILYNWGLAAFKVDQKGLALGLWRRALFADSEFTQAKRALMFAKENMPKESFEIGEGVIAAIKYGLLRELSLNKLLILNLLLLIFGGILSIRYLGQRRRALEDELPLPRLSPLIVFFTTLFVLTCGLVFLKSSLNSETRATLIAGGAPLLTAPSADSNAVFTLLEGVEVGVDDVSGDWALVTGPNSMTGWVSKKNIFINSGKRL